MKPVYHNITPVTGPHIGGMCKLFLLPKEWAANDPVIDFNTNKVLTDLPVISGKTWLEVELVSDTLEYGEKPKTNANGDYYEISTGGLLNFHDADLLQLLETLRYHEFLVIAQDKKNQKRLIGNRTNGMLLQIGYDEDATNGGTSRVSISLTIDLESKPPYTNEVSFSVS